MRIRGCAFVDARKMIADRVSAIVSSCSSIEKSSLPLVVSFTWRPIEGYEVVLHVDCGMRRRRHRSQVVPGGRTTLNRLRDKKMRVGLHHGRVASARQLHSVYRTQQTRHTRTRYLHTTNNTHISESASMLPPGQMSINAHSNLYSEVARDPIHSLLSIPSHARHSLIHCLINRLPTS